MFFFFLRFYINFVAPTSIYNHTAVKKITGCFDDIDSRIGKGLTCVAYVFVMITILVTS